MNLFIYSKGVLTQKAWTPQTEEDYNEAVAESRRELTQPSKSPISYPALFEAQEGKEMILDKDFRLQYQWLLPDDIGSIWIDCTQDQYESDSAYSTRTVAVAIPAQKIMGASWCTVCKDYADNSCLEKHPHGISPDRIVPAEKEGGGKLAKHCSQAFWAGYANGSLPLEKAMEVHNEWIKENCTEPVPEEFLSSLPPAAKNGEAEMNEKRDDLVLWNPLDGEMIEVDSIQDAQDWAKENLTDPEEGVHPDAESVDLYQKVGGVYVHVNEEKNTYKIRVKLSSNYKPIGSQYQRQQGTDAIGEDAENTIRDIDLELDFADFDDTHKVRRIKDIIRKYYKQKSK